MKSICIYGKGGIGKSTAASNIACALAQAGRRVLLVGCDPKADTTRCVCGRKIPTVLRTIFSGAETTAAQLVYPGFCGVDCVEAGGPSPGDGCAGRGIVAAIEKLRRLDVLTPERYDMVIYDVLGDVVCGGFSMPIKDGIAQQIYIVTTCDYMAMYAANNICTCVAKYGARGRAKLGGLIYNGRSAIDSRGMVGDFAQKLGTRVVGGMEMDACIAEAELAGKTVLEYAPDSPAAARFRALASAVWDNAESAIPTPMDEDALDAFLHALRRRHA